jgi:tetratricopeptide (TPR) repeat protein
MSRLTSLSLGGALLGLLLLAAAPAPAQAPGQAPAGGAVALLERAMAAVDAGDLDEAIAILEPLRESADAAAEGLAILGALYLEADRPADALAVLAPLAEREDANPAVLYNAGRAAAQAGEVPRGVAWLERSVALEPGTPAARELGLLYGREGRLRDAYRVLLPWARSHPDDVQAVRAAALAALRLRRVPAAEELLAALPQTEPENKMLWGHLLLLKGEPHGAVSLLAPLLAGEGAPAPELPARLESDVRWVLAEAYLEIGEAAKAVEVLEGRVQNAAAALLLGRARYQSGDLEGALSTLAPLAEPILSGEHDPQDPRWLLARDIAREYGRWLVAAGRYEEAIPYLQIATEREPDRKESWQALGQALAAAGRQEEAQEALTEFQRLAREEGPETEQMERMRTLREDPTAAEMERARRLADEGRHEEALQAVQAEGQLAPQDPRPALFESWLLLVMERPGEALPVADGLVERFPDHPDAHHQRGAVLLALDRAEEAEAELRRAIELAPGHVPALSDLAVLLSVRGERAEAIALLERVLEIRPDDERARATLDRLRGAGGGGG